jgi:hypothetical protein
MVVLPAPLLPSTVTISPRCTARLTPRIALIGPYALSTLASRRIASPCARAYGGAPAAGSDIGVVLMRPRA